MWFAYDLFTNERYGPYDTEITAAFACKDKAVTIRYFRAKR